MSFTIRGQKTQCLKCCGVTIPKTCPRPWEDEPRPATEAWEHQPTPERRLLKQVCRLLNSPPQPMEPHLPLCRSLRSGPRCHESLVWPQACKSTSYAEESPSTEQGPLREKVMRRSSLWLQDTIALGPDRQGCLPLHLANRSPGLCEGYCEYSLWGYIYKVAML